MTQYQPNIWNTENCSIGYCQIISLVWFEQAVIVLIVAVISPWRNSVRDESNITLEIPSPGFFSLSECSIKLHRHTLSLLQGFNFWKTLMGSGPCKWMSTWAILGDVLRKVTSLSDSLDNRAPLIPVHPFISMHCSCYKLTNVNSPRPRGVDACWSCGMWISKRKKIMKLGLLAKECLCDSWVTNNLNLFASRYIGNLPITKV